MSSTVAAWIIAERTTVQRGVMDLAELVLEAMTGHDDLAGQPRAKRFDLIAPMHEIARRGVAWECDDHEWPPSCLLSSHYGGGSQVRVWRALYTGRHIFRPWACGIAL